MDALMSVPVHLSRTGASKDNGYVHVIESMRLHVLR
jgi:hypothetical protein